MAVSIRHRASNPDPGRAFGSTACRSIEMSHPPLTRRGYACPSLSPSRRSPCPKRRADAGQDRVEWDVRVPITPPRRARPHPHRTETYFVAPQHVPLSYLNLDGPGRAPQGESPCSFLPAHQAILPRSRYCIPRVQDAPSMQSEHAAHRARCRRIEAQYLHSHSTAAVQARSPPRRKARSHRLVYRRCFPGLGPGIVSHAAGPGHRASREYAG